VLEDWELKYYKISINKHFKFFKWEISFNFQIVNRNNLNKEWEKRVKEMIPPKTTFSKG